MSDRPENPPAFPKSVGTFNGDENLGLELRDYFAAKALTAMIEHLKTFHDKCVTVEETQKYVAIASYGMADAMLRERSK